MFVGCFQISENVIVKHVQSIGLSGLFVCLGGGGGGGGEEDLLRFAVPWGTEEIAGLWFAKGGQCPG